MVNRKIGIIFLRNRGIFYAPLFSDKKFIFNFFFWDSFYLLCWCMYVNVESNQPNLLRPGECEGEANPSKRIEQGPLFEHLPSEVGRDRPERPPAAGVGRTGDSSPVRCLIGAAFLGTLVRSTPGTNPKYPQATGQTACGGPDHFLVLQVFPCWTAGVMYPPLWGRHRPL